MNERTERAANTDGPPPLKIAVMLAATVAMFGVILFWPAGRLDWGAGWFYLAILTANIAANYAHVQRSNPELIEYRSRIGEGTKTWDKIWMVAFTPPFVAIYVVAGLDAGRFGWSAVPWSLWPVGLVLLLCGTALLSWSMAVNPFFEKTVRIQTERDQRVIDSGPYRYVRHPGYTGFLGWILSAPLMLGSWWAFVPAALSVAALVVRTALEDRTLREELAGYVDYAGRVRYRLIPLIW